MNSATLYTVLIIVFTLAGSGVLTWAYVTGNPWRSLVGWSIITLVSCVDVIEVFAALRRVLNWGAWSGFVQLGLVALAVWVLALAFLRMRRTARRLQSAEKDHRIEREPS